MKSVCAWCHADLDGTASANQDREITHGICESCAKKLLQEMGKPLMEFLDDLGVPILLVENNVVMRAANKAACALLGKDPTDIERHRCGEVIECVHAHEPGGCGQQVHCMSCVIRKTVLETFASGKSFRNVRTYPDIELYASVKTMCLEISTEKMGEFVLLRIDDMRDKASKHVTGSPQIEHDVP